MLFEQINTLSIVVFAYPFTNHINYFLACCCARLIAIHMRFKCKNNKVMLRMALRVRKQMFHKCKCLETASIWGRHWSRGVAQTAYKMNINELQERKQQHNKTEATTTTTITATVNKSNNITYIQRIRIDAKNEMGNGFGQESGEWHKE